MQLYSSDQIELRFSTTAADGRWITQPISCGPNWSMTLHGIPSNSGIRVEANNSAPFAEGSAGITNPILFAVKSANENQKSFTAMNSAFESNWVTVKPTTEFYLSSNTGAVTNDTGVFLLQGFYRFVRLSMAATATPSAGTRAYYFDANNILTG